MISIPKDHQMSTISGVLHPWIEHQVSNRLVSPQLKIELIKLALKVESTEVYRRNSSGTNTSQGYAIGIDNESGSKEGKKARPDTDLYRCRKSAPAAF